MSRHRQRNSRRRFHGQEDSRNALSLSSPRFNGSWPGAEPYELGWEGAARRNLNSPLMFASGMRGISVPTPNEVVFGNRRGESFTDLDLGGSGVSSMSGRLSGYGSPSPVPFSYRGNQPMGYPTMHIPHSDLASSFNHPFRRRNRGYRPSGRDIPNINPGIRDDCLESGFLNPNLYPGGPWPAYKANQNPDRYPATPSSGLPPIPRDPMRDSPQSFSEGSQYHYPLTGRDRQPRQYHYRWPYIEEEDEEELMRAHEPYVGPYDMVREDYWGPVYEDEEELMRAHEPYVGPYDMVREDYWGPVYEDELSEYDLRRAYARQYGSS